MTQPASPTAPADRAQGGRGAVAQLRAWLARPVSPLSLAVMRILFGLVMTWECWRYIHHDRIARYFVEPQMLFPYFGWDWLQPLPEPWIHMLWSMTGLFGIMIALGAFYRVAIWGFVLVFGYFFLLDRVQYLNHFYMVLLYGLLLAIMPAHRAWSLDAVLAPGVRAATIPYWPVAALRLQTEIILIFAGLVKLTPDWLAGQPLAMWLRGGAETRVFYGALFHHDWAILAGAWGTVALHLLGAPLLLWRRTRLPVFLVYCAFHISNANLFNIGIFPWLTIAVTLIFFPPDWPAQLWRALGGRMAVAEAPPAHGRPIGTVLLAALAGWFAVQVALPLRAFAFPTEVRWTGDGHRFSWRMRIYDREARGRFEVVDRNGAVIAIDPRVYLTPRQAHAVTTRPDLIHAFAGKLAALWSAETGGPVEVHAMLEKSLNGRPFQPYTDPTVDLAGVGLNWFGPDHWIQPLTTPLPPLGAGPAGPVEDDEARDG